MKHHRVRKVALIAAAGLVLGYLYITAEIDRYHV